jgi:hypothetical protein
MNYDIYKTDGVDYPFYSNLLAHGNCPKGASAKTKFVNAEALFYFYH